MNDLTQIVVEQDAKLVINGQEVLSKKGISGKIRDVGIGFGTARHSMARREPVPVFVYEVK
jgi:hypothetical protein